MRFFISAKLENQGLKQFTTLAQDKEDSRDIISKFIHQKYGCEFEILLITNNENEHSESLKHANNEKIKN